MRPFAEVHPDLIEQLAAANAQRKIPVTLRLDPDVVKHFKAGGAGWQTRINAALRRAAGLER